MEYVWLNGALRKISEARISPLDHGLVTGDGLFEVLTTYSGQPFALSRHIQRLTNSARGMLMPVDVIEKTPWRTAMGEVIAANKLANARIRITYTTGDADLGSDRGTATHTVMIAAGILPAIAAEGSLSLVPWPRSERAALAGLKTISYGENVKALFVAKKNGANEALFLNLKGSVCEGTGTNVGWIKNGKVFTPALSTGCLAGVTRALVIELAKKSGIAVDEVEAPLAALLDADEVFLTSTLREVQWVSRIDDRRWEPGTNKTSKQLNALFVDFSRKNIDP